MSETTMKEAFESVVREKETLETLIKDLDGKIAAYEALGTPEQITEAFDKVEGVVSRLSEIGSIEEIEESLDLAIAHFDAVAKVEGVEELSDADKDELKAYRELGTAEEISTALDKAEAFIVKQESEKLSKEFGVSVDTVREMVGTYESFEKVRGVLGDLLTSRKTTKVVTAEESSQTETRTARMKTLTFGL